MNHRTLTAATEVGRLGDRIVAVVEVTVAFALMHVAFRAFKRYTALGQAENFYDANFSPGLAMILVSALFLLVRRRRASDWGIGFLSLPEGVNAGVAAALVIAAFGTAALAFGLRQDATHSDATTALIVSLLNVVAAIAVIGALTRGAWWIQNAPKWIGPALIFGLSLTPILWRWTLSQGLSHSTLVVLSLWISSAVGEECFFRGFVQSRCNEAFGRPFHLLGVRWGPGLLISAALFGLVHGLNTYDYFLGTGSLSWWWGLTAMSSVSFGLLREQTGSIIAPAILHGMLNIAARVPELIQRG